MKLFEKAKRKSLPDFAIASGFKIRKTGNGYSNRVCPHCMESDGSNDGLSIFPQDDMWRWNCFRCHKGGTVIDFASALWGCTDIEAAKRLCDDVTSTPVPAANIPKTSTATTPEDLSKAIDILTKQGYTSVTECIDYLKGRGISEKTITSAVQRGILRFLPADPHKANSLLFSLIGQPGLRDAGLLKSGSKWTAAAFRPIMFLFPGGSSVEFRLAREPKENEPKAIRYGNTKWPWWWKNGEKITKIHVLEGAIDMLSRVDIGLKYGEAIFSIPGTDAWRPEWFDAVIKTHPEAIFSMGLDNDEGGEIATSVISGMLKEKGAEVVYSPPPSQFHDWNLYLQDILNNQKAA